MEKAGTLPRGYPAAPATTMRYIVQPCTLYGVLCRTLARFLHVPEDPNRQIANPKSRIGEVHECTVYGICTVYGCTVQWCVLGTQVSTADQGAQKSALRMTKELDSSQKADFLRSWQAGSLGFWRAEAGTIFALRKVGK